ncbi:MAG: radical SAM protein [Chitinivibrionales bacterium]|nr:radical SAM protein [Chitinivibrionales bacterium]
MKIVLIVPPSNNEITGNNPSIIEQERGHNPPLGLLYIAAYIQHYTSHQVKIIDAQLENLSESQIQCRIRDARPDIVGMTAMTLPLVDVYALASLAKRVDPAVRLVLGGPHVFLYPHETLANTDIDILVLGEGEITFAELADTLSTGEDLAGVEGIAYRSGGKVILTPSRARIENLDMLPFPARRLLPYQRYTSLLARRSPVTTMFTSRGCPFGCTFCARPHLGKKFRARSAANVVNEMEECIALGINEFFIYDDTFTIDRNRVLDICNEIRKRKLSIGYDIRSRIDCMDEEMLKELKSTGCERIHYGIEAGTQKSLETLNKGITLEQVWKIIRATKKNGISTLAYFMIGIPGESREDILKTIAFSKKINPDFVHFTVLVPFPGTPVYAQALKKGIFGHDRWKSFALSPQKEFKPPCFTESVSRKELEELLIVAYKSFYTRPGYILRQIFKTRSPEELGRKLHAGLKVIFMK